MRSVVACIPPAFCGPALPAWMRTELRCAHACRGAPRCAMPLRLQDFYGAYDAQDFAKAHAKELGMKTVPSLNVVFTEEKGWAGLGAVAAAGWGLMH